MLSVGNHPAYRLAVADMAIGHERGAKHIVAFGAAFKLSDRPLVNLPTDYRFHGDLQATGGEP